MKKCDIGKNCGDSCIQASDSCNVDALSVASAHVANGMMAQTSQVMQLAEHAKVFSIANAPIGPRFREAQERRLHEFGYDDPRPMMASLKQWGSNSSSVIKKVDERDSNTSLFSKDRDNLYDYLENENIPAYSGRLHMGLADDSLQLTQLKAGDEFQFPSLMSSSSDRNQAINFAQRGMVEINGNKSGKSIQGFMGEANEMEVLISKHTKYLVEDVIEVDGEYLLKLREK